MENFNIDQFLKLEEAPKTSVIVKASGRDHSDVHYLYKLRKATKLIVGNDNMKGFSEDDLVKIHEAIVKSLIANQISHWYDSYDTDLDDKLPMDLKMISSGWEPPKGASIFDLEEDDLIVRTLLMEEDALYLWTAPTARKKVPEGHFLDPANKKYPYRDSSGTVNCGGLNAAYKAARGARGAPKRPEIASKAKTLLKKHCGGGGKEDKEDKKTEDTSRGRLTRI